MEQVKQGRQPRPFPILMLNSIITYLIGLSLVITFYIMVTILVARAYHIPVALSYSGLSFPISNYSTLWSADAIRMIFIAGPGACLLIGFIFSGWLLNLPGKAVFLRDLFYWLSFHGINLALGGIIAGVLTSSGFAWFAKWVYLNETARFFIALVALFGLGFTGVLITPISLKSTPSLWYIRWENRYLFLFSRFLIPWLTAMLIMILIRLPAIPLHDHPFLIRAWTFGPDERPSDPEEIEAWLDEQWEVVNEWVGSHREFSPRRRGSSRREPTQ